jgi:hypothetical protein
MTPHCSTSAATSTRVDLRPRMPDDEFAQIIVAIVGSWIGLVAVLAVGVAYGNITSAAAGAVIAIAVVASGWAIRRRR